MTDNRRSATRHDCSLACSLEIDGKTVETEMGNLSLGGAYIALGYRAPMGTQVRLRFRIPTHEEAITVGGHVRWATESGIGVQFDGLRAREVWSLNKYFEKL